MKDLVSIHVAVFETLRFALSDKMFRIFLFFGDCISMSRSNAVGFVSLPHCKIGHKKTDEERNPHRRKVLESFSESFALGGLSVESFGKFSGKFWKVFISPPPPS